MKENPPCIEEDTRDWFTRKELIENTQPISGFFLGDTHSCCNS
jgi:hypothetical protein